MDQAKVCVTFVLITGVIKQLLTVSESFLVCSSLCLHVIVILKAYYSLPFFFFFFVIFTIVCLIQHNLYSSLDIISSSTSRILTALKAYVAITY